MLFFALIPMVSSQLPACRGQLQLETINMTELPITVLISKSIPTGAAALTLLEEDPNAENCPIVDHPFERYDAEKFYQFGPLNLNHDIKFAAFLLKGTKTDRYNMNSSHWGVVASPEYSCLDGLRLHLLDGTYYDVGTYGKVGIPHFIHPEELGMESFPYWKKTAINAGTFPGDDEGL